MRDGSYQSNSHPARELPLPPYGRGLDHGLAPADHAFIGFNFQEHPRGGKRYVVILVIFIALPLDSLNKCCCLLRGAFYGLPGAIRSLPKPAPAQPASIHCARFSASRRQRQRLRCPVVIPLLTLDVLRTKSR